MKKAILIVVAVAFTALIGTQAFACYWDGSVSYTHLTLPTIYSV